MPWAKFKAKVNAMHLSRSKRFRVNMLEKIGDYARSHRFTATTGGGTPSAVYTQVQYYLCRMQKTDPTADAVITTRTSSSTIRAAPTRAAIATSTAM